MKRLFRYITVLFCLLTLGFLVACSNTVTTSDETDMPSENTEDNTGLVSQYEITWHETDSEYFRDLRGGFQWNVPSKYTVEDKDLYYIIYNENEDGCLLVFANADCGDVLNPQEAFNAYELQFENTKIRKNGKLVDFGILADYTGNISKKSIGSKDVFYYPVEIYTQKTPIEGLIATTSIDRCPFVVVKVGECSLSTDSIIESAERAVYSGSPITDHPSEQLALEKFNFQEYDLEIPTAWDVYDFGDLVAVRPPECEDDTLSDCAIVMYQYKFEGEPEFITPLTEYSTPTNQKMSNRFASALMQNPNILNKVMFGDTFTTGCEYKDVNGIEMVYGLHNTIVVPKGLASYLSLPGRNVTTYHYAVYNPDNGMISHFVFACDTFKNTPQMENLSTIIMNKTFHKTT